MRVPGLPNHRIDVKQACRTETKDEDELSEAVQAGLLTHEQARAVYTAGHQVIELVKMQGPPFSDGWERWKPNPSWRIPVLLQ